MENKWGKLTVHMMLGLALVMGSVQANEEEKERAIVGERALPQQEMLAIQEERAERFQEKGEESKEEPKDGAEKREVTKSIDGSNFLSTHAAAYHNPYAVALLGDTVELEDGSIWSVKKGDRFKTLNWLRTDSLVITPNHSFFSLYTYRIRNLNTNASIEVNLTLGPIYNGARTHWVAAIDYFNGQLCLEDGSIWDVSGFDMGILNKWLLNDTIIIGTDDTLLGRTNILINVNTNNYVSADCVY